MCENNSNHRSFSHGAATLTQCLECRTLGLRIGTSYVTIQPEEVDGISRWLHKVEEMESRRLSQGDTLYLQMLDSRIMLALNTDDFADLQQVLSHGAFWVNALPPVHPETLFSQAVH